MAKGFKKGVGGGNPLNFKIVSGTTKPEVPKENTIWVNTDTKITSWAFDVLEPTSPVEGMVWFNTVAHTTSVAGFNALKKNHIVVNPVSCSQWINGAWVQKPVTTYRNGEWCAWNLWIFKSGEGLQGVVTGFMYGNGETAICDTDRIYGNRSYQSIEPVDVTVYSTAHFTGVTAVQTNSEANTSSITLYVGGSSILLGSTVDPWNNTYCTDASFDIDVTNLTGNVYIGVSISSNTGGGNVAIKNIWFD